MPVQEGAVVGLVEARRAPRYPVVAPVRFRTCGEDEWSDGITVNIGRLGLMLRTRRAAPGPGTVIEVRVVLAADMARACAHLTCRGRVVRVAPPAADGESCLATTIDDFGLQPVALAVRDQASSKVTVHSPVHRGEGT